MGCCLGSTANEPQQPSPETRRRQCLEAAERRQMEQKGKGFQDPGALDRARKKQEEMDRLEREQILAGNQGGEGLKVL